MSNGDQRPKKSDITEDKINEMNKAIDFEDRITTGRIAKAREKIQRKKCGRNLK